MATRKLNRKRRVSQKALGNPMVAMAAADAAKNMTPNQKMWLIGGSILLLGGLTYAGYRIVKSITGTKADETSSEMGDNLRNLTVSKGDLTITSDKAILMAQQIFDAMNKRGTDEDTIADLIETLKSQSDLLYVIKSFGIKNYGVSGESDSWIAKKIGYTTPLNMSGWIKEEIKSTSDYYKRIKAVYEKFNVPL